MNKIIYENLTAFHPGYYIEELVEELEMSQDDLALKLGITSKDFGELISGNIPISKEVAKSLSALTGTSSKVWLELQKKYNHQCRLIDMEKERLTKKSLSDYAAFSSGGRFIGAAM